MLAALLAGSALGSAWTFRNSNVHSYQSILFGPSSLRWFPTGDCVRYLKVSWVCYTLWVRQKMSVVNTVFPLSHQASELPLPDVLFSCVIRSAKGFQVNLNLYPLH